MTSQPITTMIKLRYPCPCPRCNGMHVSHRTLCRHHKKGENVPSIADWRHQQGRPLQPEDLGIEFDIEGNDEGGLSEDKSEEEDGNRQGGFIIGRAQKRGHFGDHNYQVCVTPS